MENTPEPPLGGNQSGAAKLRGEERVGWGVWEQGGGGVDESSLIQIKHVSMWA